MRDPSAPIRRRFTAADAGPLQPPLAAPSRIPGIPNRLCLADRTVRDGLAAHAWWAPPAARLYRSRNALAGCGGSRRCPGSMRYQRIAFSQNIRRRSPGVNRLVISWKPRMMVS